MNYMEQIISKEELDDIKKVKGEVTGDCLKNDLDFVIKKGGKDTLRKIEETMAQSGFPIDYKKMKLTDIYPASFPVALIIIIQRMFNYNEKDLEEMGRVESKISSTIIRLFMKYFISFDMLAKNAQRIWREHYKMGDISVTDYDKNGHVRFKIENFNTHVFICHVLRGYFAGLLEMIVGKKVTATEPKCVHKGNAYHEFLMKW